MSAEAKDKFLSHCSQISAGDRMQIIRDLSDDIEVKVLTSQTHTYQLGRVSYVSKDFCSRQESRRYALAFCIFLSVKAGLDVICS